MDVLFQLLVPEIRLLDGLEPYQEVFTWGEVDYPQNPLAYRWGHHIELIPRDAQSHVLKMLPKGFIGKNWLFFDIEGDGLDLLEGEINGFEVDWGGKRLDDFLSLFLSQYDHWALVFELYSDQIDNVYEATVDECIRKLRANLKRDIRREGFIAIS